MEPLKPIRYRRLKRLLITTGVIAVMAMGLHLLFVHNARTVLKQYISEESGGKIQMELSELSLNPFTKRLKINKAVLFSTDSINEPITYNVRFSELSLKVGSVWRLLFQRKLALDSIKLYSPVVQVVQWRKDTTKAAAKDELSIPQEMGKFYTSLMDALDEFGIRRIIIDNAQVSLVNKIRKDAEPVTVSRIYFDLARRPVVEGKKKTYEKGKETLELTTTDQNIILPGGRHRLAFKAFNLHLLRESIELDSCTITAIATDSVKSSYKVFFKKLVLTGVDFAALSSLNVIKADSVYCVDPFFDLNLHRSDAVKKKTGVPDPDKILSELTGNLDLAFVGVTNAGIHLDIHGKSNRSFSNANKDNFEIREFRINPDSSHPVTIGGFNMILRDYQLYNEDSTSSYSFDSLHFSNNQVVLNNFVVVSKESRTKLRNLTNINVPHFALEGLDWYQLIFEQNFVAKEAFLNSPVINFTRRKQGTKGKKVNLFDALLNLDSMVALDKVSVINGQVNMKLGPATSFEVQNIDFSIQSNKLLGSTNKEGLRSAVDFLSFSRGVLQLKDMTVRLERARFSKDNLLSADRVLVNAKRARIDATINNVSVENLLLDDDAETIEVDGIRWKSANVALRSRPAGEKEREESSRLFLRNVDGRNTQFRVAGGSAQISTFVRTLTIQSLVKSGDDPLRIEGFHIAGNDLLVKSKAAQIAADSYDLYGSEASSLTGVRVQQVRGRDSIDISSPQIRFTADLNNLIANDIHLASINAVSPVIRLSKWDTETMVPDESSAPQLIRIDQFTASEPDIRITTNKNDTVTTITIPRSNNSSVKASGMVLSGEGLQLGSLVVNTTDATFKRGVAESMGIEKGTIALDFSDIRLGKKDGKLAWSGFINTLSLQNANGLQMAGSKNNLRFAAASLGNLSLSSDLFSDFSGMMKKNVSAWLRIPEGQFIDSNTTIRWFNADYNNSTGTLQLDSFVYHPTQPLDTVLAYAPYQLDYMTLTTGPVTIREFNVDRYKTDSSFLARSLEITNPVFTVYRDKEPPVNPFKKDRLLPVDLIQKMRVPLSVGEVNVLNGTITYSEKHKKSREEGTFTLNNIEAIITNISNSTLNENDTLSLTMTALLMNEAPLNLNLKESYSDSLSTFVLTGAIGATDLTILNPVLVPLSNMKLRSGKMDSLSFKVVAREDLALGTMNMHYSKLRIRLIKAGNPDESTLAQKAASFLANTFLIKSNNTRRTGVMYWKRSPKQSFVNYIVKMTMSGITSSVGVKKNRKLLKQYQKDLKKTNHPPIQL